MHELYLDQEKNKAEFGELQLTILPGRYKAFWCGYKLQFLRPNQDVMNPNWPQRISKKDILFEVYITEGIRGIAFVKILINSKGKLFYIEQENL